MKKLILLMPFLMTPTLIGCNKPIYLELWSKEINYINNEIDTVITRKFEGKQCIEIVTDEYNGDEIYITTTETLTYNDRGDVLSRVIKKSFAGGESSTTINDIAYDYRDDGLISKKTVKIITYETTYISTFSYEYDDAKRLTHEIGKLGGEVKYESISRYDTKFNTYSYNKTWDFYDEYYGDRWVITENTLNEAGDITQSVESYEKKELINGPSKKRLTYTYDGHHCPTHIEEEFCFSPTVEWGLVSITDTSFHKNNPQKILNSTRKNPNGKVIASDIYTYDEYDRKTSYVHNGLASEPVTKTTWEYDQVISA